MASAEEYARWIVANQEKKGSPEFETVANAYKVARGLSAQTQQSAETPQVPKDSNPLSVIAPILSGMTGTMRGGANLITPRSQLGTAMWPPTEEGGLTTLGQFADPLAWGIAGGVGKLLPYAKVTGQGILGASKAIGKNIFGGAAAGGAISGLSTSGDPQGILSGAEVGATANVVLPPTISLAARGAGRIWDVLVGRYGAVKASEIARNAAGGDLSAIRAATAAGAQGETATQAAAGVNSDTWNALGELAVRNDRTSQFSRLAERQSQDQVDALRRISGGATQTEARQVAEQSKTALNQITTPMRETELGAAGTAGTVGADLQAQADALRRGAFSKGTDVRRLSEAQQIAEDLAQSGRARLDDRMLGGNPPASGLPRLSGRYAYATELSDVAERIAQLSADDSVILGTRARFKQMQVDSLAAHGLKPLDGGAIIRALDAKIADPSIGSEIMKEKVLTTVRNRFSQWTNAGGVIDSSAIYGIRKSAVNDAIEQLMGSADPKAKSKAAAGILQEIKPLIDDAIEKAGGTGWRDYLKTFETGMNQINQQKMGAKLMGLFQESPKEFVAVARGDRPKVVEKIFQTEYDLSKAMGEKVKPIQGAADFLERNRRISEGAARGEGALSGILSETISRFKLPNWINAKIAVTNRALIELESRVNKQTMEKLVSGMKTGQTANELLSTLPTSERNKVLNALVQSRVSMLPAISGMQGIFGQHQPQGILRQE
jgi:hypothetical protein